MKKKSVLILLAVAIVVISGVLFFVSKQPKSVSTESDITISDVSNVEVERSLDEVVEQATPTPEVIQATPEPTVQPTQTPEPAATPEVEDEDPIGTVLTEEETTEEAVEPTATPEAVAEKPAEKPVEAPKPTEAPKPAEQPSQPAVGGISAEDQALIESMGATDGFGHVTQGTSTNRETNLGVQVQ